MAVEKYHEYSDEVPFPKKYRNRYPFWLLDSFKASAAEKGEDIIKYSRNIIKIVKNTIGVEDNL